MAELTPIVRTPGLSRRERTGLWRHVLSQAFVPADAEGPRRADGFRGRLRGTEVGTLRIYEGEAQSLMVRRTSRLIAAAPAGCYKVGLQLAGSSVVSQAGREVRLRVGEFAIYDTDRPFTLGFDEPNRVLVLMFPHAMLGLPAERVARLTATPMSCRDGLGALIAPFLIRVAGVLNDVDLEGGLRLAGNVLDLLTTMLAEQLDTAPASPSSAHRAQLVQITVFIEQHLDDCGLSPDLIAAAHHISTRQLHKLFRGQGTTVSAWVRQRRLEHCRRDLRDPLQASRPVSAIAARWGYPDAAHFSRLFKATFGVTPREYRVTVDLPSGAAVPLPGGPLVPLRVSGSRPAWRACPSTCSSPARCRRAGPPAGGSRARR
jgi:AraC-like DNA-binding protein